MGRLDRCAVLPSSVAVSRLAFLFAFAVGGFADRFFAFKAGAEGTGHLSEVVGHQSVGSCGCGCGGGAGQVRYQPPGPVVQDHASQQPQPAPATQSGARCMSMPWSSEGMCLVGASTSPNRPVSQPCRLCRRGSGSKLNFSSSRCPIKWTIRFRVRCCTRNAPSAGMDTKEPELNNLFHAGRDGVVPVAMEQVPGEGYRFFLLVGEFDFCGVEVGVEF